MDGAFEESWFFADMGADMDAGKPARLPRDEAFHLRKVLRVRPGRRIVVTNGKGQAFLCDTADAGDAVQVTAVETLIDRPAPPRLHMALGLLKGRDLEEPVEGLCQLPLAAIHLVLTDHTQEHKGQDHAKLLERLRSKSLVALKQSKKPWLTEVRAPVPLKEWRTGHPGPLVLVHPGPDRLPPPAGDRLYVLSGPEGGFSQSEVEWLTAQSDCGTLSLGETRIRGTHAPLLAAGKLMGLRFF